MRKRYIVALDSHTKEQNQKFKDFINENSLGWWYWINGFWLLTDPKGAFTARQLRDKLGIIYPEVRKLIIELRGSPDDDTWSGYGPNTENKNMFNWLITTWPKKE